MHATLQIISNGLESYFAGLQDSENPDMLYLWSAQLGIADVRSIHVRAHQKPVRDQTITIHIGFHSATVEAQNALLKTLEEPPETTVIRLYVASDTQLLPTVRSRLQTSVTDLAPISDDFVAFVSASYADRLATIDVKTKAKDTSWMQSIASGYQHWIADSVRRTSLDTLPDMVLLTAVGTRGASNKMLLEDIALRLPVEPN